MQMRTQNNKLKRQLEEPQLENDVLNRESCIDVTNKARKAHAEWVFDRRSQNLDMVQKFYQLARKIRNVGYKRTPTSRYQETSLS